MRNLLHSLLKFEVMRRLMRHLAVLSSESIARVIAQPTAQAVLVAYAAEIAQLRTNKSRVSYIPDSMLPAFEPSSAHPERAVFVTRTGNTRGVLSIDDDGKLAFTIQRLQAPFDPNRGRDIALAWLANTSIVEQISPHTYDAVAELAIAGLSDDDIRACSGLSAQALAAAWSWIGDNYAAELADNNRLFAYAWRTRHPELSLPEGGRRSRRYDEL